MLVGYSLLIVLLPSILQLSVLAEDSLEPTFEQRDERLKELDLEKVQQNDLAQLLPEDKRSSRLIPLRGGKDTLLEDLEGYGTEAMSDVMVKKAFVPMRGRKDKVVPYEDNDVFYSMLDEFRKRAFTPMRGRKDQPYGQLNDNPSSLSDNLRYLHPQRTMESPSWWVEDGFKDLDAKRKTFYGMRGKRALRKGRSRFFASRG